MGPIGRQRLPGQQVLAGAGGGEGGDAGGDAGQRLFDVSAAVLGRVPFGDGVLLQPNGLENRGGGHEAVDFFMEIAVDLVKVGEALGQLLVAGQAVVQVGLVAGAAEIGRAFRRPGADGRPEADKTFGGLVAVGLFEAAQPGADEIP